MYGWLQKVTTTKMPNGITDIKKVSWMVRSKSYSQGVCCLYISQSVYIPEHLLGKVQNETCDHTGNQVSHVWQWEQKDE